MRRSASSPATPGQRANWVSNERKLWADESARVLAEQRARERHSDLKAAVKAASWDNEPSATYLHTGSTTTTGGIGD
jgi:hypothetical protein